MAQTNVFLNREHPQYDLALEVLMQLAGSKHPVPLSDLAKDMGCRVQHPIVKACHRLRDEFRLDVRLTYQGGRSAYVGSKTWAAEQLAQRYWYAVYSKTEQAPHLCVPNVRPSERMRNLPPGRYHARMTNPAPGDLVIEPRK